MLVLSFNEFVNNADKYLSKEQRMPIEIENNGVHFVLSQKKLFTRKKRGSLEKARKEADALMADPNAKTYDNFDELLDELGIKL